MHGGPVRLVCTGSTRVLTGQTGDVRPRRQPFTVVTAAASSGLISGHHDQRAVKFDEILCASGQTNSGAGVSRRPRA